MRCVREIAVFMPLVMATDVISGFLDEPAGSLLSTAPEDSIKALNTVSFVGGLAVVLAVVLFVVNLAVSMAKDLVDDDAVDPWEGHTLEWTREPETVTVSSHAPLLDAREAVG